MTNTTPAPDFANLPREQLETMQRAGKRIRDCYRVLGKSSSNMVGEVLRAQGDFFEWDHFPKGDVYDHITHSQYYYHAHPAESRLDIYGREHGHFHTFMRPKGMPESIKPAPLDDYKKPAGDNDALSHLIAISMDRSGFPVRLFTTNRWVTGETWYAAADVDRIIDSFDMDLSYPSWPVNVWMTAMMILFRPTIQSLLVDRDVCIKAWQADHSDANVFEDRTLEVTSFTEISVDDQIAAVEMSLKAK